MFEEAINRVLKLGNPNMLEVGKLKYVDKTMHLMAPPSPKSLALNTLSGLVDYLKKGTDQLKPDQIFIVVETYHQVSVYSHLVDENFVRHKLIHTSAEGYQHQFKFGHRYNVEDFIIQAQANFSPGNDLQSILQVVSNMKAEKVTSAQDDGVAQVVTAKAGVTLMTQVKLPNPVVLAPYRTFPEVAQPVGRFVLRVHQAGSELPSVSLTEADGGQWKIQAIESIREFLQTRLEGFSILA